jgi:hypothetical protein
MTRGVQIDERSVGELIDELAARAQSLASLMTAVARDEVTPAEWLDMLARIGQEQAATLRLASLIAQRIGLPKSGSRRMLTYFRRHLGEVVDKDQLGGIAGIHEWARRVRELRAQGWDIASDQDLAELKPGQYTLRSRRQTEGPNTVGDVTDHQADGYRTD